MSRSPSPKPGKVQDENNEIWNPNLIYIALNMDLERTGQTPDIFRSSASIMPDIQPVYSQSSIQGSIKTASPQSQLQQALSSKPVGQTFPFETPRRTNDKYQLSNDDQNSSNSTNFKQTKTVALKTNISMTGSRNVTQQILGDIDYRSDESEINCTMPDELEESTPEKKSKIKEKEKTKNKENPENSANKEVLDRPEEIFKKSSMNIKKRNFRNKDKSEFPCPPMPDIHRENSRLKFSETTSKEHKKIKRKEIERYNVRFVIAKKPSILPKPWFERDTTTSRSHTNTPSLAQTPSSKPKGTPTPTRTPTSLRRESRSLYRRPSSRKESPNRRFRSLSKSREKKQNAKTERRSRSRCRERERSQTIEDHFILFHKNRRRERDWTPPPYKEVGQRRRKNKKGPDFTSFKPVGIIDLNTSLIQEIPPSPKDAIILSDSNDYETEIGDVQNNVCDSLQSVAPPEVNQNSPMGPKTRPESCAKLALNAKPAELRVIYNPLHECLEIIDEPPEDTSVDSSEHEGPNTPLVEPPYSPSSSPDAFQPTKIRSSTPEPGDLQDQINKKLNENFIEYNALGMDFEETGQTPDIIKCFPPLPDSQLTETQSTIRSSSRKQLQQTSCLKPVGHTIVWPLEWNTIGIPLETPKLTNDEDELSNDGKNFSIYLKEIKSVALTTHKSIPGSNVVQPSELIDSLKHITQDLLGKEEQSHHSVLQEEGRFHNLGTEIISNDNTNNFDESQELMLVSDANALEENSKESEIDFPMSDELEEEETIDDIYMEMEKKKERRKEIERYNVRTIIGKTPRLTPKNRFKWYSATYKSRSYSPPLTQPPLSKLKRPPSPVHAVRRESRSLSRRMIFPRRRSSNRRYRSRSRSREKKRRTRGRRSRSRGRKRERSKTKKTKEDHCMRKRRRRDRDWTLSSEELFASGDNSLVSVSLNNDNKNRAIRYNRKKYISAKERRNKNEPELNSIKSELIADLERSLDQELLPSPKDDIILSESDDNETQTDNVQNNIRDSSQQVASPRITPSYSMGHNPLQTVERKRIVDMSNSAYEDLNPTQTQTQTQNAIQSQTQTQTQRQTQNTSQSQTQTQTRIQNQNQTITLTQTQTQTSSITCN